LSFADAEYAVAGDDASACNDVMTRTHSNQRMTRFRPIGAWRTSVLSKREWTMPVRPIYLIGFVALLSFVAVVLACSGSGA
jgi:hypothetical protein